MKVDGDKLEEMLGNHDYKVKLANSHSEGSNSDNLDCSIEGCFGYWSISERDM